MGLDDGRDIGRARARTTKKKPYAYRTDSAGRTGFGAGADPYAARRDSLGRTGFGDRTPGGGRSDFAAQIAAGKGSGGGTSSSSRRSTGGSTGGTGGTGSGGTTTTTPPVDTIDDDLETKRKAALQAALDAIGADFNLQGAELDSQRAGMGNDFMMGMAAARQGQRRAGEDVNNNMLERGILRSGMTISNQARAQEPFISQKADLRRRLNPEQGRLGSEQLAVENKRNLLTDARTAAEAQATIGSEREKLDLELMRKLAAAGLG